MGQVPNAQLRNIRLTHGLTQEGLAELVNRTVGELEKKPGNATGAPGATTGSHVSRWETGETRWPRKSYRKALRHIFNASSDRELGFYPPGAAAATVAPIDIRLPEGDEDVNRQEFLRSVTALAAAGTLPAAAAEGVARAESPTPPGRVGRLEIEQINQSIEMFGAWQDRQGGGACMAPLATQVTLGTSLLQAHASTTTKNELHSSVGFLTDVAGWGAFDAGEHRRARSYFRQAQECAHMVDDWGLRANVLSDMARQACYLKDYDEALTLIEGAQVRQDRLPARARSMLEVVRARVLGSLGRLYEARDSVSLAEDLLGRASSPESDPAWIQYFDAADLDGDAGHALVEIALHGRFVDEARARLANSLRMFAPDNTRGRALALGKLARLELEVGDPEHGVRLGRQVLESDRQLVSRRAADDLKSLRMALKPHRRDVPGARELGQELGAATA